MRTMKKLVLLLLLALSSVLLPACQSAAPRPYDVSLGYDPVTIERFRVFPSVEVDVVAANETILRQLEQTEIDDYFSPSNLMRDSMRKKTTPTRCWSRMTACGTTGLTSAAPAT